MEYWEPTQRVLQGEIPLVRRPKLTDTLLRKPPFRFLHDVISEVCRKTGYAKGLFTSEELISTNIKDKDSKVAYLWKIIDCIGITLHASVPVRPLKIVAGLEPEQTNVFLQMLAAATMIDQEVCERAVASVLGGEKQPPPGQGGTQWIQLLKEMMSPRATLSSQDLPQPQEMPQQHSVAKKHGTPNKVTDQDAKTHSISTTETGTPLPLHPSQTVTSSCVSSEQRDDSLELPKKASKAGSPANGLVSQTNAKSYQHHESQNNPVPQTGSKACNGPSQRRSHAASPNQRTSSKESSVSKKRQSKQATSTAAGNGVEKRESVVKTSDASESSHPLSQPVIFGGEEAREGLHNSAGGSEMFLQKQGEIDASDRSPATLDLLQCMKDTTLTEEKCPDIVTPRACTPGNSLADRGAPTVGPRPQSARKAPPMLRSNLEKGTGVKFTQDSTMERPASGRASAREICRKPSILLDTEEKDDDEQDNMPILLPPRSIQETILTSIEGAGKLVRDILETKDDLQDQASVANEDEQTGIILGQIRGASMKKEDVQTKEEEIEKLREAIQTLCQTANPLGKSMDYLQEDVEVMSKEYQFWIKEHDHYSSKLEEEKRVTENMLQGESGRVFELDEEMRQQRQHINTFKAQILHNDEAIMKLLRMLTTRSTR